MKHKSTGIRILLILAAIALGVVVQVIGTILSSLTDISAIEYIAILLGFIVMGVCIYKWAVK
jgi:hypothetical protein